MIVLGLLLVGITGSVPVARAQGCAVSGRVIDDKGNPIPFAAVSALRGPSIRAGASANRLGEYCIRELAAGEYLIRATARTQPPSASPACDECCDSNSEFGTTFYRRSRSRERASTVSVVIGRTASGVDILMRRVPAYCVRGEVRDDRGALLSDVAIALEGDSWSAGVLNEGGRFLLTNLPAGSYTLVISDRPRLGRVLARRVIAVVASNMAGIVITAPSGSGSGGRGLMKPDAHYGH